MEITYDLIPVPDDDILKLDLVFQKLKYDYSENPDSHPRDVLNFCKQEFGDNRVNNLKLVHILLKSGITDSMKDRHNTSESYQKLTVEGFEFIGFEEQKKRQIEKSTEKEAESIPEQVTETVGHKVMILYDLGLIETLRTMKMNPDQIGNILQEITGENAATCKKIYNALISDHFDKNNPVNSKNLSLLDKLYSRLNIQPLFRGKPNSEKIKK